MRIFTKLSPISNTRTADPRSRGAKEESLFRRPRQAGRIYPPHSAYALRVQLVCPIKDESSRRTDRPQPNTHQQEQQHFYPPEGQTRTLRELYKKTIFCIIRGDPNYSCRRKQDGTYKICFLYNSVIPLAVRVPWGLLTTPHLPNFLIYRNAHTG